jgi:hypothetical protein
MTGIIRWLRGLFRKEKPKPKVIYCGGVSTGKRKRRKRPKIPVPSTGPPVREPTRGEILKELGVTPGKPRKKAPERVIELAPVKEDKTLQVLRKRWRPFINILKERGPIHVSKHDHYGSLRGRDILRFAKKDLRRLGYSVKIKPKGYGGDIWLSDN